MTEQEIIGFVTLFVLKFLAHLMAARQVGRIYGDNRPWEIQTSLTRTFMGVLIGLCYGPLMSMLRLTPWSEPPSYLLFIPTCFAISWGLWYFAINKFFEKNAVEPGPLKKSATVACLWSLAAEALILLRILPGREIWFI